MQLQLATIFIQLVALAKEEGTVGHVAIWMLGAEGGDVGIIRSMEQHDGIARGGREVGREGHGADLAVLYLQPFVAKNHIRCAVFLPKGAVKAFPMARRDGLLGKGREDEEEGKLAPRWTYTNNLCS